MFTQPDTPAATPTPQLTSVSTVLPENPEKLIYLRVSMKQRLFGRQFSKDGACAPHVNRGGISWRTQENLRSAVPQRHNLDKHKSVGGTGIRKSPTVMIMNGYRCKLNT